jgi:broad specificity phosphatase PhoE
VSTVLLVRHGLTAMTGPVLAGRTPGVHLDERGQKQAAAVAERIAAVPLSAVVTSPMERCVETAEAVRAAQPGEPSWQVDERLIECGYGDWTGRPLKELIKDPLWKVV